METYTVLNAKQVISEKDPFTKDRYRQFYRFFPRKTNNILDIGCNTGRGGKIIKSLNPSVVISGLDCVRDRLDRLPVDTFDILPPLNQRL